MAFNFSATLCLDETKHYEATYTGDGEPAAVVACGEIAAPDLGSGRLAMRFQDKDGRQLPQRLASYTSGIKKSIFFSLSGWDFRGVMPVTFQMVSGSATILAGTISPCGADGGGNRPTPGNGINDLPDLAERPPNPCLPPPSAAPGTPPVPTPCGGASGTGGPAGFSNS